MLVVQVFIAPFTQNCSALRLVLPVQLRFTRDAGFAASCWSPRKAKSMV